MPLLRLVVDQLRCDRPLQWNVYNAHKQLLLHKGYVPTAQQLQGLMENGVYAEQADIELCGNNKTALLSKNSAALWQLVKSKVRDVLTLAADASHSLHEAVNSCAEEIIQASTHDVDSMLVELLNNDGPENYSALHAVQCGFVASLLGNRMGLSDTEQRTLAGATLTMNLGMSDLQNKLTMQSLPLNPSQRKQVNEHGKQSRAVLEKHGINNQDWLRAVENHHITPNGGPLPTAKPTNDLACIMHYVDVYLAKVSSRNYRPAMPAFVAIRDLFVKTDGKNNPYVSALVKELGIYPPGSCVRLANGEICEVVRRGEQVHTPWVKSLLDADGTNRQESILRDTSENHFKVIAGIPKKQAYTLANMHPT